MTSLQRQSEQLKLAGAQARELARFNESLQLEAERRNLLFNLKKASEQINLHINTGSFQLAYKLITQAKKSFLANNLKQEDFSTLEFKNLAEEMDQFFSKIDSHFASVVPPEIMRQMTAAEKAQEKKDAEMAAVRMEELQELVRLEHSKARQSLVKALVTAVFLGAILFLLLQAFL